MCSVIERKNIREEKRRCCVKDYVNYFNSSEKIENDVVMTWHFVIDTSSVLLLLNNDVFDFCFVIQKMLFIALFILKMLYTTKCYFKKCYSIHELKKFKK